MIWYSDLALKTKGSLTELNIPLRHGHVAFDGQPNGPMVSIGICYLCVSLKYWWKDHDELLLTTSDLKPVSITFKPVLFMTSVSIKPIMTVTFNIHTESVPSSR